VSGNQKNAPREGTVGDSFFRLFAISSKLMQAYGK